MKYFQLVAFILEIVFLTAFSLWGILYSLNIIKDKKSWLNSRNLYKIVIEILLRGVMFLFFVCSIYSSLIPRFIDIPKLITGKFNSIEGYATIGSRGSKDFYEHVYINGIKLDFFLDSGIKNGQLCKISYLPKSQRAIIIKKEGQELSDKEKNIGIPWGPIIVILYVLFIIILNRLAFWLLAIGSAIFYPLNIYFYFNYGKLNGAWLPKNNDAAINIIGGLSFLSLVAVIYFIEKILKKRTISNYVVRIDDQNEFYISKLIAHFVVFIYILSTLSYLKAI